MKISREKPLKKLLFNNVVCQVKRLLPTFALIYLPLLGLIGSLIVLRLLTNLDLSLITRDPHAVANSLLQSLEPASEQSSQQKPLFPFYIGLVSNFGVLLWCTTAAVCFFTYMVLRPTRRQLASFFLWSAGISTVLLFDDLFLIHEEVMPHYLGISEKKVFAGYGVLILGYLLRWWKHIRHTDYLLLVLAFVFFGLSILVDLFAEYGLKSLFLEDSCKLTGIVSWSAYYLRTCLTQLNGLIRSWRSEQT